MNELAWLLAIYPDLKVIGLCHQELVQILIDTLAIVGYDDLPMQPYGYTYSMLAAKIARQAEEEKERT